MCRTLLSFDVLGGIGSATNSLSMGLEQSPSPTPKRILEPKERVWWLQMSMSINANANVNHGFI